MRTIINLAIVAIFSLSITACGCPKERCEGSKCTKPAAEACTKDCTKPCCAKPATP